MFICFEFQLTDTLRSNENVTVEMNPQDHHVIVSGADGMDLHALSEHAGLNHTGQLTGDDLHVEVSGHAEIIGGHDSYAQVRFLFLL